MQQLRCTVIVPSCRHDDEKPRRSRKRWSPTIAAPAAAITTSSHSPAPVFSSVVVHRRYEGHDRLAGGGARGPLPSTGFTTLKEEVAMACG